MVPEWEFRLTKIENLLVVLTERQVDQQVEMVLFQDAQKRTDEQILATSQQIRRTDRQIQVTEKQIEGLALAIGRLNDSQERTEARLQSLIDTVDRLRPRDQ